MNSSPCTSRRAPLKRKSRAHNAALYFFYKYFLNENHALEGLVSFDPVAIGALYVFHRPLGAAGFQWYFGGGGFVAFSGDDVFGAMGVVGLDYKFQNLPLNLSLDWKPELNIVKDISFEAAAIGLSIRFAFK